MKSQSQHLQAIVRTTNQSAEGICTFELYNLDREIFFSYAEDLQVTEDGFLSFCMSINLHTQEVTLVLPVELTLQSCRSVYCHKGDQSGHMPL